MDTVPQAAKTIKPDLISAPRHNHISAPRWAPVLAILTLLFALIEVTSNRNFALATYGLFFFGVILLLINVRLGFLYYLAVNLLSTDSSFTVESFNSVHTITMAGVTIMTLWTLVVLSIVVAHALAASRFGHLRLQWLTLDKLMLLLGILFTFAALNGLRNLDVSNLRVYISDASYYVNAVIGYLAVRLISRDRQSLNQLIVVIISCLVIRAVTGIVYFLLGIGSFAGANVRAVTDSIRVIFPLLVLLGVAYYFYGGQRAYSTRLIIVIGAVAGMFNVVNYASRGNFILLFLGIILLLVIGKSDDLYTVSFFKVFLAIVIVVLMAGLVLGLMQLARPGSLDFINWKISTLTDLDYDRELSSAAVRWLSFKNIVAHLWHSGTLIWGEGLGGWFTDDYFPFTAGLLGGSAFRDEWILQGRLYKPHETVSFVLLKMGIGGVLIYYGAMFLLFLHSVRVFRRIDDQAVMVKFVVLALVAFMPFLFYKNFISKIQVFMGVSFGVITAVKAHYVLARLNPK